MGPKTGGARYGALALVHIPRIHGTPFTAYVTCDIGRHTLCDLGYAAHASFSDCTPICTCMQAAQDVWLSVWAKAEAEPDEASLEYYMGVYVGFGLAAIFNRFARGLALIFATLTASQARIPLPASSL